MSKDYKSTNKNIISNWGNILIDTSVIIRAINYVKNKKVENKFCYDLIKYLSETKFQKSESSTVERRFFVSSITIAEILENTTNDISKSQKIIQLLNAKNLTILDFDEDVANIFNGTFCDNLGQKNQDNILKRWGQHPTKDLRQSLNNDLMILASGLSQNIDVVLCFDKGMYKIGKKCDLHLAYLNENYFHYNETYFFEYYSQKSDADLLQIENK